MPRHRHNKWRDKTLCSCVQFVAGVQPGDELYCACCECNVPILLRTATQATQTECSICKELVPSALPTSSASASCCANSRVVAASTVQPCCQGLQQKLLLLPQHEPHTVHPLLRGGGCWHSLPS